MKYNLNCKLIDEQKFVFTKALRPHTPLDWLGPLDPLLWAINRENSWKFIFPSPSKSASAIMDLTSASVIGSPRLLMVSRSSSSLIKPSPSLSKTLKACATSSSRQSLLLTIISMNSVKSMAPFAFVSTFLKWFKLILRERNYCCVRLYWTWLKTRFIID